MGSLEDLFAHSSAALEDLLDTITGSVQGIFGSLGS